MSIPHHKQTMASNNNNARETAAAEAENRKLTVFDDLTRSTVFAFDSNRFCCRTFINASISPVSLYLRSSKHTHKQISTARRDAVTSLSLLTVQGQKNSTHGAKEETISRISPSRSPLEKPFHLAHAHHCHEAARRSRKAMSPKSTMASSGGRIPAPVLR